MKPATKITFNIIGYVCILRLCAYYDKLPGINTKTTPLYNRKKITTLPSQKTTKKPHYFDFSEKNNTTPIININENLV